MNPRVCLSTIDPATGGGVSTMTAELYNMLGRWGWQPSLLYLSVSAKDHLSPRRLLRRGQPWDTRLKINLGMRGMAVGHVPAAFFFLGYFWPYPVVQRYIKACDMHIVSGGPLRGISLALAQKHYLIWVSTLALDEYKAKAETGDPWAQKLIASKWLPLLIWQERVALKRSSLILALSPYTAERIVAACPDVADRIRIVPCPVEILSRAEPTDKDGKSILCVGRLRDSRKNLPLLLKAFHEVSKQCPDVFLRLVGGTDRQALEKWLTQLGLVDRVIDTGKVSDAELREQYARASVFVLPSQQEGLGIVVLEAMAAGVPVVSTRCGGPEGYVIDGQTGYLVPLSNPTAMAQAILRLLNNDSLRQQMSKAAQDHARRTFSRPVVERQFRQAFEQVYPEVMAEL